MKLHDLRPAAGAHRPRKRVGRGISAGGGKTAGRGTKGQKARAGASIPAWFEGGQTPLQIRIPKLHGFKNRFRVEYEVVNLGRIAALVAAGVFEPGDAPGAKKAGKAGSAAPITINQEILRAAGLVSTLKKPLKILGNGDLDVALFVVADAFSRSAVSKIEAAGGSVQVLEVPTEPLAALGIEPLEPESTASSGAPADGHDHAGGATEPGSAPAEPQAKPAAKPAAKSSVKASAKSSPKPAPKATAKPAAKAKATAKPTAKPKAAAKPAPKSAAKPAKPAKQPAEDA